MIYFLRRADGAIKIGTTKDYYARLYILQMQFGKLELLGWQDGERIEESRLHRQFSGIRIHRRREWFSSSDELQEFIRANTHRNIPSRLRYHTISFSKVNQIAINLIVAEYTAKLGKRVSGNDALLMFVEEHTPDIAKRAKEIMMNRLKEKSEAS